MTGRESLIVVSSRRTGLWVAGSTREFGWTGEAEDMEAEAVRLSHGPPSYINDSDTLRTDTVNAESVRIQNSSDRPSQIPSRVTLSHSQTSSAPHLPARAPAHLAADSSTLPKYCNLPLLRRNIAAILFCQFLIVTHIQK